ncbi:MAG: hypothetical protein R3A80_01770 [Bdellovibrionota bacterium]
MKIFQFRTNVFFTTTLLFLASVSTQAALAAGNDDKSESVNISSRIQELRKQLESDLKSQEETRNTLTQSLEDRKKVTDQDSQFQLGTIEAERRLAEISAQITATQLSIRNLDSSKEALSVCTESGAKKAKEAQELIDKIKKKLSALNAPSVEADLTRSFEELAKLKQAVSPTEQQQVKTQKELDDLVSSGVFKKLSDTLVENLTSSSQIKLAANLSDKDKEKLTLTLLLNPTLLDDVSQASKNAGRETDNLLDGGHPFNSTFLKAIAPNGVFPQVSAIRLSNGKFVKGISSEVAKYLQEQVGLNGLEGIALSSPAAEIISLAKLRIVNSQVKESMKDKKFSSDQAAFLASEQLETQLNDYLEGSISKAKALIALLETQQQEINSYKKAKELVLAEKSKEANSLQNKANEVRALKRLQEALAKSADTCSSVDAAAIATIEEVTSGKLSAGDAVSRLFKTSREGLGAIKEIERLQKQPTAHGLKP